MPPEMRKVHRTNRSRDDNQIHFIRFGDQNCNIADRIVVETDPQIGRACASIFVALVHYLFPASAPVLILDHIQFLRIVRPASRKAQVMHRDSTHTCNHPPKILIVRIHLRGKDQHRVVQSELGLR